MKINKITGVVMMAAFVAVAALITPGCKNTDTEKSEHVHRYTCPHHPEVVQSSAGTCPKCGMKLKHMD